MLEKICEYCGEIYFRKQNTSLKCWEKKRFCSHKCYSLSMVGKPNGLLGRKTNKIPWNKGMKGQYTTTYAGTKTGKPAWNTGLKGYKSGEDNSNWKGGIPLCCDCGKQLVSYKAKRCVECNKIWQKGENIYNFKGGFTPHPERNSYSYKIWRMDVFKRDWFTCKVCGYKGKEIQAHHIKKVKDYPELLMEKSNGITLCTTCHNKTRNKEHEFEEQFINILKLLK